MESTGGLIEKVINMYFGNDGFLQCIRSLLHTISLD